MKVKQLRKMLLGIDDEMEVKIPANPREFDGFLFTPCESESGVSQIADFETEVDEHGLIQVHDEEDEMLAPQKDVFMLCPHGFSDPHDTSHELN